MFGWGRPAQTAQTGGGALIQLRDVVKTYQSAAGSFTALRSVSLDVRPGEFVAVVGKSGSGKSTLINMITGIDRPTSGEVVVAGCAIQAMGESRMAVWRGRTIGIVFQFFQLLPTLSIVENVMLPMDLCHTVAPRQRRARAMSLLAQVDLAEHAHKLPAALSGGQQQRVAIARALANDPPLLVADEPTGNLDSRTAESVIALFERLVGQGKTILMVTHDIDLARQATRSILVADGAVVNEDLMQAVPRLTYDQMGWLQAHADIRSYQPGEPVVRAGEQPDGFYIIIRGVAEVWLPQPDAPDLLAETLRSGQFFGELGLLSGRRRRATVRAASGAGVTVAVLDPDEFAELLKSSPETRGEVDRIARLRAASPAAQEAVHG